ncbi:EF-hand domain-containing protein [Promicromonospora vindobonensis]|uniref:EF-hand domain-containing protein n=1 Tax=Promicromonospora vindobonensis TaxID=195748 RepID=A0ABW5VVZ8_9MICO
MTTNDELSRTFVEFDGDGDGRITADEFRRAMATRGEETTDKDLDEIFGKADHDQDGRIDLAEFTKAWDA